MRMALFALCAAVALTASAARASCERIPDCELVWADEFDGAALDPDRWEAMVGDGTAVGLPSGWGNEELQHYLPANATIEDGHLVITARRQAVEGSGFTSARLRTLGRADWRYGRFEMRARMPIGRGLWPAFWMMPSESTYGGWAASGEIDIVEYLGHEPDRIHGTIHFGGPWPDNLKVSSDHRLAAGTFHDDFHRFALEWEPGELRWYVDDTLYATRTEWTSTGGDFPAPFDRRFHLILNLAVGGRWPGAPDEETVFPQRFVIDWVRVYQSRLRG